MANSLTDWLSNKVLSTFDYFDPVLEQEHDKESLLEDVAFIKGAKLQIVRFFSPQSVVEAEQELGSGAVASESSQSAEVAGNEEGRALWACLADRIHFVHVKFSHHCVNRFNSTYSRELISLSGSIIILRKFRPSISYIPSILENKRNRRGPFAPPESKYPTLFLEIESFEVLGSINEVIFWDTGSLQGSLLGDEFALRNKGFKNWFKKVDKIMKMEERRRERRRQRVVAGGLPMTPSGIGNETSSSASANTTTISNSTTHVSPYAPPPFQKPSSFPRAANSLSSLEKSQHSTQSGLNRNAKSPWGDFQLSMGEDDFGIEAAASQMLDRHISQEDPGRQEEEEGNDFLDPLSLSSLETADIEMSTETDAMPSASDINTVEGTASQSNDFIKDTQRINETTQRTDQDGNLVSQSFSLPFSIGSCDSSKKTEESTSVRSRSESMMLKEMEGFTTLARDQAEEEPQSTGSNAIIGSSSPSQEGLKAQSQAGHQEPEKKALPEQAIRHDDTEMLEDASRRKEAEVILSPTFASSALSTGSTEEKEKRKWNNLIRRVTPEEIKERERTYSSRVDLIVD